MVEIVGDVITVVAEAEAVDILKVEPNDVVSPSFVRIWDLAGIDACPTFAFVR